MKKVLLSCLAILSVTANATVVDFESGLDPLFNYDGVISGSTPIASSSGYNNVTAFTGSSNFVANPYAVSPSTFSWASAGTFDLTSFVIAGAWGSQTLTIEGLLNNAVTFTSSLAVDLNAGVFNASWSGIDAFRITTGNDFIQDFSLNGSGQHWALDNVTVNENVSVPTPAGILLFGLGIIGLAISRKRNA